jgi:copper chaperone CopZ
MTTRIYDVPAISCEHCQRAIEGEVTQVPGVTGATVTLDARTVRVDGDATDSAIRAAIDRAGYDVLGVTEL